MIDWVLLNRALGNVFSLILQSDREGVSIRFTKVLIKTFDSFNQ